MYNILQSQQANDTLEIYRYKTYKIKCKIGTFISQNQD